MDEKNGNGLTNTLKLKRPRLQVYKKLKADIAPVNDLIHHYCNLLLESWTQPTTREYSYQILSFDNFHRLFYKTWKILRRHNRPPRKVHTFTLAFENDSFIVLNYSGGYRIERFLLLTESLVQFLIKLHEKYNKEAKNGEDNILSQLPLLVSINRDRINTETMLKVEQNIDNPYGITYGPFIQQLFECYILPEIEQPCTLLGHALGVSNIESQSSPSENNALCSSFIRINEPEGGSETESCATELEDEIIEIIKSDVEMEEERLKACETSTLTHSPTIYAKAPRTRNIERIPSPLEADVASCLKPKQSLSQFKQPSNQNSSNLNSKRYNPNTNATNIVEKNQVELNSSESNEDFTSAKMVLHAEEATSSRFDFSPEQQEIDAIDVCCGLDSRYCKCYSIKGYIPKKLYNEIVQIEFISTGNKIWRMLMAKCTYNIEYEDIYKTGNLKVEHLTKSKLKRIPLTDFIQKCNNDLFHTKFAMSVPCKLFQKWINQQRITIDQDVISLTMIKLEERCLLLQMNVLSHVFTDFKESEFSLILKKTFVYVENFNLPSTNCSPDADIPTDNYHNHEGRLDVTNIVVEPDIASYYSPESRDPEIISANIPTQSYTKPKKTVSIGIQCDIPDMPFRIICLADIRSKIVTNPPITGDFLFKHGFETSVEGDYSRRSTFLASGWQQRTPRYDIKILSDLSICMYLKDDNRSVNRLVEGLDMDYINRVDKLFNDTLEWEKEAVQGVALPFYFKKLKPAYIKTENDFPSTLVAKKKITSLIGESMHIHYKTRSGNIPVLWISTRNLELSMIRHRLTSDHVFPLFKKSTNLKYSIDSIYFPNSVSSPIVYNTKFGTFDTLPMELQQTSKVFLKLSDYPKPFLLIISDAYVFNSKLVQQCEALLQFDKAKQVQTDFTEGNRDHCIRANAIKPPNFYNEIEKAKQGHLDFTEGSRDYHIRTNAIKPPNFYNENISRVSGSFRQYELIQSPLAEDFPSDKPSDVTSEPPKQLIDTETPLIEEVPMNELQVEGSIQLDKEVTVASANYSQADTVEPDDIINQHKNNEQHEKQNSLVSNTTPVMAEETNGLTNSIQKSTLVRKSLPLQKKYSIIQERNREIRRNTDKMFLKRTYTGLLEKRDLYCVKPSKNGFKVVPLYRNKNNEKITEKTETNVESIRTTNKETRNDSPMMNPPRKQHRTVNNENGVDSLKFIRRPNKIHPRFTRKPMSGKLISYRKKFDSRKQITYDDILTPARIDEENYNFDLEKAKNKYFTTISEAEPLKVLDSITPSENEHITEDNLTSVETAEQAENEQSIKEILASKETTDQRRNTNVNENINDALETLNNTDTDGTQNLNDRSKNLEFNNFVTTSENCNDKTASVSPGKCFTKNTEMHSSVTSKEGKSSSPKEEFLRSLTLPQLMLSYPMINSTENINVNNNRHIIYKRILNEKIKESIQQYQLAQKTAINKLNMTSLNRDISVDIKVTLNSKNHVDGLPQIGPPVIRAQKAVNEPISTSRDSPALKRRRTTKTKLIDRQFVNKVNDIAPIIDPTKDKESPCYIQDIRMPNGIILDGNSTSISTENNTEYTAQSTARHMPLIASRQNASLTEQNFNQYSPTFQHINAPIQFISTRRHNVDFLPQSAVVKSTANPYVERVDVRPHTVHSETRCQSTCCCPVSTIQTLPFQSTALDVLRFGGPPRMIPPPTSRRPLPLDHMQAVLSGPDFQRTSVQSMPFFNSYHQTNPQLRQNADRDKYFHPRFGPSQSSYFPPSNHERPNMSQSALSISQLHQIPSQYTAIDPRLTSSGNHMAHNGRMLTHRPLERMDTSSALNPIPSSYSMNFTNAIRMQSINIERSSSSSDPDFRQQMLQNMLQRNNEIRSNYARMVHSISYNYSPNSFSGR